MSLDVRVPTPEEKSRHVLKWILWPLTILGAIAVVVLAAMVLPNWLGYKQTLEHSVVTVKVFRAPEVKSQVIVGIGKKKLVAELPDLPTGGKTMPDGSRNFELADVLSTENWPKFQDRYVQVADAQVQRIVDDYVVTVGTSPEHEIFVLIPETARPSNDKDWGPQIEAKARLTVVGYLRKTPPADQARTLFHIQNLHLEPAPLPPLYLAATQVKVSATKPLWGNE